MQCKDLEFLGGGRGACAAGNDPTGRYGRRSSAFEHHLVVKKDQGTDQYETGVVGVVVAVDEGAVDAAPQVFALEPEEGLAATPEFEQAVEGI